VFFNAARRIFNNGIRDSGGIPQARPSWEATPEDYPIKTLPWGAYMDAQDVATITLDGGGAVKKWVSAVVSRTLAATQPYYFGLYGEGDGTANPSIGGGVAVPNAGQYITFNGTQRMRSGTHYFEYTTDGYHYGGYTAAYGATSDQGMLYSATRPGSTPMVHSLTGLWRADSFAIPTWSGTASVGTSGGQNLTDGSGFAQPGSVVNGYTAVDCPNIWFDGAAMSNFFTTTAWAITVVFYARTAAVDAGAGNEFLNPCLVSDSNAIFILSFTDAGVNLNVANSGGVYTTLTIACSTAQWHLVHAWYDGTDYHLQLDGGTPVTQTHGDIGSLINTIKVASNYDNTATFDGEFLEIHTYDSANTTAQIQVARELQNRYAQLFGYANSFYQLTPAAVPANTGGPRGDGINDYLTSDLLLSDVFEPTGASGTLTFAWYGDAASAPNFGTVTAQTPYANPGIFSDHGGYFTVVFTTSGITVGAYDGVPRDSGGGPGTNDGWQMVTEPLAVTTDGVVQVRWGAGTLLELRIATYAGI
jgi:hypothetical protein